MHVMGHARCHDSNMLGAPAIECIGNHADTIVRVITTTNRNQIRGIARIWPSTSANLNLELRRVVSKYSHDFGVGQLVCPIADAPGMRWQRRGYYVIVYPEPGRNQIVEKRQLGVPYDVSSCPGLRD